MRFIAAILGLGMAALVVYAQSTPSAHGRMLALCITRHDRIHESLKNEILVLGELRSGVYRPIADDEPVTLEDSNSSQRVQLMKRGKEFDVFNRGACIGSMHLTSISLDDFDCSPLFVGTGSPTVPVDTSRISHSISGSGEAGDFDYSLTYRLALSSLPGEPVPTGSRRATPGRVDSNTAREFAVRALAGSTKKTERGEVHLKSVDLCQTAAGGEGAIVFAAVRKIGKEAHSLCGAISVYGNRIDTLLIIRDVEEGSSWGAGYSFLDALDLDNDGIPELIFSVGYYESTGFEVYKFIRGRYRKVMETIPWGC